MPLVWRPASEPADARDDGRRCAAQSSTGGENDAIGVSTP